MGGKKRPDIILSFSCRGCGGGGGGGDVRKEAISEKRFKRRGQTSTRESKNTGRERERGRKTVCV